MKTGKELILDLPNGVRRNFILELYKQLGYKRATNLLSEKYNNLEKLVLSGFVWKDSIKGVKYWIEISLNV